MSDGQWQLRLSSGTSQKPFLVVFLFLTCSPSTLCFILISLLCSCSFNSSSCVPFPPFPLKESSRHANKDMLIKCMSRTLDRVALKITESPPAVFSLAPRLHLWCREHIIYEYRDKCISTLSSSVLTHTKSNFFGFQVCFFIQIQTFLLLPKI